MNPEDIRRFYAEEIRVVANLRKELGGCADGFGSFVNPEGD
jgi:hypothetical protein